jgi:EAL domain-containing protein (putative c-di-GMP-specific phosphodiesterase class I)/PleD family two-component response regulator
MSKDLPSHIILGDTATGNEIADWLESLGLPVVHVNDLDGLAAVLPDYASASLIIDSSGDDESMECIAGLDDVLKKVRPPLVVFLSGRADQDIRLRAVEAGVDVFLTKPVQPRSLLQYLRRPRSGRVNDCRIFLAGDTPHLLSKTVSVLEQRGMAVKRLRNPSQLLLSVINFSPDLLLISDPLAGHAGGAVGRMIHQLPEFEDLPIIYIRTGDAAAGADAIEAAPVAGIRADTGVDELEALVRQLVKASRSRRNRMNYLRDCDRSTGLLNRHGFVGQLQRGVHPHDGPAAIILLELENLQHSHPMLLPQQQDELINMVANSLGRVKIAPLLDARIGEYVFAFMVAGKDSAELGKLGQLLVHAVSSRIYDIGAHSVTVACSAGIALSREPPVDDMALFALAACACDEARLGGSNRVSLRVLETAAPADSGAVDLRVVGQLRDVIDNSRFRLFYQPIASLHGNGVEKYEVLLRVQDGNRMVRPSSFLAAAEQTGMMTIVDRWVVGHAVRKLCDPGSGISLFVKVSAASMHDPDFLPWLRELFREHGAPGKRLIIEIGDASVRDDIRHAAVFAADIRQLGCGIALQHRDITRDLEPVLERIHASYVIVIDRNIKKDDVYNGWYDYLQNLVEVAEGRHCRVVTGMVETAGSLQLLWKCGVHYIQGNFLQEPDEALDFDFGDEEAV